MKQTKRKLIRHGGSIGITLPIEFLRDSQLKVGDEMAVAFDDVMVAIKPVMPRQKPEDSRNNEQ